MWWPFRRRRRDTWIALVVSPDESLSRTYRYGRQPSFDEVQIRYLNDLMASGTMPEAWAYEIHIAEQAQLAGQSPD